MRKLGTSINETKWGFTPDQALAAIRRAGFASFFIGYECGPDMESRMAQYAEGAARQGIWFECIHAPFGKPGCNSLWLPGEDGDVMRDHLIESVQACERFGVPIAVVHLSSGDAAPCVTDIGHARFDAVINEAVKRNVTLAFENQRKIGNLAFILELYDDVPQVRFCWDLGHEACFTPGREYMPLFGKKLVYTHIHDNDCVYNGDLHLIPFDGKIDYTRRMDLLRQYNYQGTLTLEIAPKKSGRYDDLTPDQYYARAYAAALRLRDMLDGPQKEA